MSSVPLSGLTVLILEDEPLWRRHLVATLEKMGAEVTAVDSLTRARLVLSADTFDYALIDVNLPDGLGTDLLHQRVFGSHTNVIVMTSEGGVSGAVQALRLGASDYLQKPFEPQALGLSLARVRQLQATSRRLEQRSSLASPLVFGPSLSSIEDKIHKILASDRRLLTQLPPVLILGETGTGKTTVARWIHTQGPRSSGPLVETNCSSIPDSLAESELFGHEKGAFTDARSTRIGLFEAAHQGTLFLDELSSLSLSIQAKLLTVLEDGRIKRVGGSRWISVDVRVIGASNRDPKLLVAEGLFRADLYHRLDLFRIGIPPLRERGQEILTLATLLLSRIATKHRLPLRPVSAAGCRRLIGYQWPGNIRELMHELERALVFEEGEELKFDSLMGSGGDLDECHLINQSQPANIWWNPDFKFADSGFSLENAILCVISAALEQSSGNVSQAARKLGVSRDYLRYRLKSPTLTPDV